LFNETEGMTSRQCTGEGQPSVFKCRDGRWLYPTVNGVSIINPQKIENYCTIPLVSIENVFSLDDTVSVQNEIIPLLSSERVTFTFTATEFAAPDKIQFKYILEGYDEKFQYLNPGNEKKVDYHNLSSGDHTFHIWGLNNEGGWGEQAATFSFRINPPIYLNPFFMILFIAVTITFSSALIYINHRREKQKKQDKYKTSRVDPSKIVEITQRLDELMENEKLFLNPDLTLKELSLKLKMHSNYISRIINEHFGMSYNDFINKYRIEEVKKRFEDPEYRDKTVLEIIYETGFYSKSVFNTAFKKFTGMTPSLYRKQIK
jgi:AraC-like DNA-binding protein